jgi:hypothetical protein
MTALCTQLLHSNNKEEEKEKEKEDTPGLPTAYRRHHKHIQEKGYGRCEWGKRHPPGCPRKRVRRSQSANLGQILQGQLSTALADPALPFWADPAPITGAVSAWFGCVSKETAGNNITTQMELIAR